MIPMILIIVVILLVIATTIRMVMRHLCGHVQKAEPDFGMEGVGLTGSEWSCNGLFLSAHTLGFRV